MPDRFLTPAKSAFVKRQSQSDGAALIKGYAALARWDVEELRASRNSCESIQAIRVSWQVPNTPSTDSDQTIYLHMGMETTKCADVRSILQPVLKWGAMNDGKKGWSIASYYVSGKPGDLKLAATTEAVPVAVGDDLGAAITLLDKDQRIFKYLSEFVGVAATKLYIASPNELVQTGVALEVDHVMKLSDLPNSDATCFKGLEVILDNNTKADVSWEVTNAALRYDVRAVPIVHEGVQDEIEIHYR